LGVKAFVMFANVIANINVEAAFKRFKRLTLALKIIAHSFVTFFTLQICFICNI
jgi:hypothetical protein